MNKQDFLLKFIELSSKNAINENALLMASDEIYGNKKAYLLDFPSSIEEVVKSCESFYDNQLLEIEEISSEKSITSKVKKALYHRIYGNGERKEFYQKLSIYYFKQANVKQGLNNRWSSVDFIWKLAGDKSLDYNYYSKRGLLYAIYNRATQHYTNSSEKKFEETSLIIDKMLEKIRKFNNFKQNFKLNNIPFIRVFTK